MRNTYLVCCDIRDDKRLRRVYKAMRDFLPARMLNEYVYCPRLFYYEWVEGLFAENRETVEGALRHAKLDEREDGLVPADEPVRLFLRIPPRERCGALPKPGVARVPQTQWLQ